MAEVDIQAQAKGQGEAVPLAQPADPYRPLRIGRRIFVGVLALFCLFYYPAAEMVVSSLIPLVALFGVGLPIGFIGRRKTVFLYGIGAWLVVAAVVLRRVSTARFSPELFLFDGALAGYPAWSLWLAEVIRVGVNLWSLWMGAKLGRRLRFAADALARRVLQRTA